MRKRCLSSVILSPGQAMGRSPCRLVTLSPCPTRRSGYTLLEVMLAIAIGLVLVAALYVAMDVQFRYMQTGRDAVVEGQVARGLLSRMAGEIRLSLATLPKQQSSSSNSSQASNSDSSSDTTTSKFNYGLTGDEFTLSLYVSTLPHFAALDYDIQTGISDLSKVTYWVEPGQGLARQEVRNVVGNGLMPDEGRADLLAAEIVDLHFRYFDPTLGDWTTIWDGTTSGPPLAVEIQMTVQPQSFSVFSRREPTTYRTVVHIPTATIPQSSSSSSTGTSTGGTSP